MVLFELESSQILPQVSTYELAFEMFKRMKRSSYVPVKLIELMEEYTDDLREAYSSEIEE